MPLLDHFRAPLRDRWPWDGIHANWAVKMADLLNAGLLPSDYNAISLIKRGPEVEPDVTVLPEEPGAWAPPHPSGSSLVAFSDVDLFEVQVIRQFGGARLRAAVELASPANKDRPGNRRAYAVKCASYLQQSISVVVIDVVTERLANLHAEILGLLDVNGAVLWQSPSHLYAIAYRIAGTNGAAKLEIWCEPLAVGAPLPTLPLWLEPDLCVPLRLEESYQATCGSLRIPDQV